MKRVSMLSWVVVLAAAAPIAAQDAVSAELAGSASGGLCFVANEGQWDPGVVFQLQRGPATAWFHDAGVVLDLVKYEADPDGAVAPRQGLGGPAESRAVGSATIRLSFVGAAAVAPEGTERLRGTMSYLHGADPRAWFCKVPTYGGLRYEGLYPGVDAVFRSEGTRLAYDLHLAPGAPARAIELHCDGVDCLDLRADGTLSMRTPFGDVVQSAPCSFELTAWGERIPVSSRFVLRGTDRYGFEVDRIDASRALVIDPGIDWSTYLGGGGNTALYCSATVGAQTVAVAGLTRSVALPAPWNSNANQGGWDALVAVIDTASVGAAAPLWTALLGGSADEVAFDVAYDAATQLVTLVGMTSSSNPTFPCTANAFQGNFGGQWDGFIATFDMAGTLVYSTYLGTSGIDRLGAVSANGPLLTLAGHTDSPAFPIPASTSPFQPNNAGSFDVVVVRMNPSLQPGGQILNATYLGSPSMEGFWIPTNWGSVNMDMVDLHRAGTGEVTVIARSAGQGYPTTPNAFRRNFQGVRGDIVISRLDPTLSSCVYSTYFGGYDSDLPGSLEVDPNGVVTLAGSSWGSGVPTTTGAPQPTWAGRTDMIVARLDPSQQPGQQLLYGTYLGGWGLDELYGMEVEPSSGVVIATGGSSTPTLPTTPGAWQSTFSRGIMGIVLRLKPDNNGMQDVHYLSYVGHTQATATTSLFGASMLEDGRVALAGWTDSANVPMLPSSPQPSISGPLDGLLMVMDLLPTGVTPIGVGTPACALPRVHMQVNSAPLPGNANFELFCEQAPANASGFLAFGRLNPVGQVFFGARVHLQVPALATVFVTSDARGFAWHSLSIPAGLRMPPGITAQYLWILPMPCNGAVFGASNALSM